jgi:hypothetical protein
MACRAWARTSPGDGTPPAAVFNDCHILDMYGQLNVLPPVNSISLINVSIGVFPTIRTKNSCSMTYGRKSREFKESQINICNQCEPVFTHL